MPASERPREPLLTLRHLVWLHTIAIQEFGGGRGIRDRGVLESALMRPMAGFGGQWLHNTPFERAAALGEGVVPNHGFVDGNKRTGIYAMAAWLEKEGYRLEAARGQLRDLALKVARHEIKLMKVAEWLEQRSAPTPQ